MSLSGSHRPGMAGPGVRAAGEFGDHAEHTRLKQAASGSSTVTSQQMPDQRGRNAEGRRAAGDGGEGLVLICGA